MIKKSSLSIILLFSLLIYACQDDNTTVPSDENENALMDLNLPDVPFNYEDIQFPNHFLTNNYPNNFGFQFAAIESDNTPVDNPTTNEGALLGRVLFYEEKLSANGTIACASCHSQSNGFSDEAVLSVGFDGGLTRRHSMSLTNAA